MSFTYIAMPYMSYHEDPVEKQGIMDERMEYFWKAVGWCLDRDIYPISPMSMEPVYHKGFMIPEVDWHSYSTRLIPKATSLLLLKLDGWETSAGVKLELEEADKHGLWQISLMAHDLDEWAENHKNL